MMTRRVLSRLLIVLFCAGNFVALCCATACQENKSEQNSVSAVEQNTGEEIRELQDLHRPLWPALALLRTGENPLWFELGPEGPSLIDSPAAAALLPYSPWPHARFVTGILPWDDFLVIAVNRDGFLVLASPGADTKDAVLYRSAGGFWDPYTAESFFIWDNKPAVLLYRNDFFSGTDLAPPLSQQVYVLDKSSSVPVGAFIPALNNQTEGRETEILRRGPDGFWYFRVKDKGNSQNRTEYFRALELSGERESISLGEWRNSDRSESNAPPLLAEILELAAALSGGIAGAARTVSPDFEGFRFYSAGAGQNLMCAYYRESPEPLALVILGDGRGFFSRGLTHGAGEFSLPALPEDFVYTGAALLGNILAASWEEQREAGIGAAGFMVVSFAEVTE